ncbi:hypothetical protein ATCC90586_002279 [Pythium insidiosum]|nr:hypothetical protein ATCC90586_002279 [Pythium insidiosum]
MCASKTFGYQGFRSFAVQPCATLKPGETKEARATKFSKMGSHIITPALHNRVGRHAFESIVMRAMETVQPGDYHVPDKRGVSIHEKPVPSTKFIATSTFLHDFPDYEAEMRRVLAVDDAVFEAAFHHVLEAIVQAPESNNGMELAHVPRVVKHALGDAAVARVQDLFVSFLDHGLTPTTPFKDHITWDAFHAALAHVRATFERELGHSAPRHGGHQRPDQPKVIPATTPASSYHLDYGRYGDQPLTRPYMRRRGMASTTDDLQPGTAKGTFQIPGYMGFIPHTTHNPDAVKHGEGAEPHGRKEELRLYHSDNIPGYTGHKPVDCKNYQGEARAGSHPLTTTGAAYIPHL